MLRERELKEEWIYEALEEPDIKEDHDDGTTHYIKQIPEIGNRWLRVVVNVSTTPKTLVTAFLDRRLRKKHENKSR